MDATPAIHPPDPQELRSEVLDANLVIQVTNVRHMRGEIQQGFSTVLSPGRLGPYWASGFSYPLKGEGFAAGGPFSPNTLDFAGAELCIQITTFAMSG